MTGEHGLVRAFADFSMLPDLLALPRLKSRRETVQSWADLMEEGNAKRDHVENDDLGLAADDPWDLMADDAWQLCERLGLLDGDGEASADAWRARLEEELADRIWERYLDANGEPMARLIQDAARVAGRGRGPWAGRCPGLLLCEFMRLVEMAQEDAPRAESFAASLLVERREAASDARLTRPNPRMTPLVNRIAYANAIGDFHGRPDGGPLPEPAMSVTEARATAILLTHSGILNEGFLEGPVNCLVPPEAALPDGPQDCAPVVLEDGVVWDQSVEVGMVCARLLHLMVHDHRANAARIFSGLGIDPASRRATRTMPEDMARRQLHWINKGLSMELLCSMLLARLDVALRVDANCLTHNRLPYGVAPHGKVDMVARYGGTLELPALQLVAEVSAKRNMSRKDFLGQAEQAVKFGRALHESTGRPVYAVLINGVRIGEERDYADDFRAFAAKEGVGPGAPVRLVAMCADDLAAAVGDLSLNPDPSLLRFDSSVLAEVFDELIQGLHSGSVEKDWMHETWKRVVLGRYSGGGAPAPPPPRRSGGSPSP